jgi:hypothetical protein
MSTPEGASLAAAVFHGALNLFSVPPPGPGESLTPAAVNLALHWIVTIVLVVRAGPNQLDKWPSVPAASSADNLT